MDSMGSLRDIQDNPLPLFALGFLALSSPLSILPHDRVSLQEHSTLSNTYRRQITATIPNTLYIR